MDASSAVDPEVTPLSGVKTYNCGTLTYTKIGLFAIFAWMLWGDFCFTLMEAVVPSILPLKLKSLGCSNWLMGLILGMITILHQTHSHNYPRIQQQLFTDQIRSIM